ncbi:hypothetical protein HPB50_027251 [Hyalomma asiaticum]|uniref:Uncharacterized protein n=1 Tax=Hyalomma asiaticum TaxID=266040 RepID=A0ACB7TS36_HYAAI|nr:hypothetical protein HPB50_027251 [Hyalomma asiaticum]
MDRLKDVTARDPELQQGMQKLEASEPINRECAPHTNKLLVVQDVSLKGMKIVIPCELRKEMLGRLLRGI